MTIRLLVADDHELVREGLRANFENTEIDIVGEATTCQEAIQLAGEVGADVMLLDIRMPGGDGFDVLRSIRRREPLAVVVYSMHDRKHHVRLARELGASGFLTKLATRDQLLSAIKAAHRGQLDWSSSLADVPLERELQC